MSPDQIPMQFNRAMQMSQIARNKRAFSTFWCLRVYSHRYSQRTAYTSNACTYPQSQIHIRRVAFVSSIAANILNGERVHARCVASLEDGVDAQLEFASFGPLRHAPDLNFV